MGRADRAGKFQAVEGASRLNGAILRIIPVLVQRCVENDMLFSCTKGTLKMGRSRRLLDCSHTSVQGFLQNQCRSPEDLQPLLVSCSNMHLATRVHA